MRKEHPAEALAVFGTIESDRVPQGDSVTHLPAGYRQYDDATRINYGIDAAVEYFGQKIPVFGRMLLGKPKRGIPGEDNDDGLPFSFLNSPQFKYRAVSVTTKTTHVGITFQHDDAFTSDQGFWAGTVQEKTCLMQTLDTHLAMDYVLI